MTTTAGLGATTASNPFAATGAKTTVKTEEEKKTDSALKGLGDNFDQFLKLLTTQMQNQDPLKPMDTNEMTNQLVQFANVEQNIATNSRLDKLLKLQQSYATSGNLYYLGKAVEYPGADVEYTEGMQSINLGYELEREAKKVRIDILDSAGRTIMSTSGETGAGKKHTFTWDFTDDAKRPVQPGSYRINIAPESETKDNPIKATTYTWGMVTAVDVTKAGEPVLKVNNKTEVPVAKVVTVS